MNNNYIDIIILKSNCTSASLYNVMEFLLLYANVQTPSALIYLLIVREPDIVSLTSTFIYRMTNPDMLASPPSERPITIPL